MAAYVDGRRFGRWTFYWYNSGKKRAEGHFRGGKREGTWRCWSPAGQLVNQGEYRSDVLVSGDPVKLPE